MLTRVKIKTHFLITTSRVYHSTSYLLWNLKSENVALLLRVIYPENFARTMLDEKLTEKWKVKWKTKWYLILNNHFSI